MSLMDKRSRQDERQLVKSQKETRYVAKFVIISINSLIRIFR